MKKAVLVCTCSFACPSMKDINFGELSERIRMELPQDYLVLYPRICEANGESLLEDLLKPGVKYITLACKEEKQKKLLRDGFARAGVPMDDNWKPISISFKTTEQALTELAKALEEEEK
ncbi:MAG: hypothetical protein QHJ34_12000 [bacterium]|jgi:hypothetical protein|nr:hypothetical protein [candidate division KSB1 bacterium]MDH7560934.1 hypothetical protein [bacterium]